MPDLRKNAENLVEDTEKSNGGKNSHKSCEKIAHQKTKITMPLAIEPFAVAGKIKTKCCSEPTIEISPCCDCKDICHYLITQEICIEIPIKFGAFTEVEDTHVECGKLQIDGSCDH